MRPRRRKVDHGDERDIVRLFMYILGACMNVETNVGYQLGIDHFILCFYHFNLIEGMWHHVFSTVERLPKLGLQLS